MRITIPAVVSARLEDVLRQAGSDGVDGYLELDEFDEPPLFIRIAHVDWLASFPLAERNAFAIEFAQRHVERIREAAAASFEPDQLANFLCCVSIQDVESVLTGDAPIVTPCFLTSTRMRQEFTRFTLTRDLRHGGLHVAEWLESVVPGAYRVYEHTDQRRDPELERVYVDVINTTGNAVLDSFT